MCLLRNPLLYRLLCWVFLNFSFTKPWFSELKTQYKVLVSYKHEQLSVFRISSQILLLAPCKSTCFSPVLILNWARLNLDRMGTACFFLLADHWTWLISSVTWYLEAWYQILEACLHKNTILTSSTMSVSLLPSAYASLEEGGKEWKCWSKPASHSTGVMKHPCWKCRRFQEAFNEALVRRNNVQWDFKWSPKRRAQIGFFSWIQ